MPGEFTPVRAHSLSQLRRAVRDPSGFFLDARQEAGPRARLKLGPMPYYLLSDPEDVRHVLVTRQHNYTKSVLYEGLKLALGKGLVTSEGTLWKRQRKLAQPGFHPRTLPPMVPMMARCTSDMLDQWQTGSVFDVHKAMMQLTFRIVGLALFSRDLAEEADTFGAALGETIDFANRYVESPFPLPAWIPTPGMRRFRQHVAVLDDLVHRVISERRQAIADGETTADLLGMLMAATDEKGQMSDKQLRDEVLTMVAAGHETTAVAMSWTLMFLSQHPHVLRRLEQELEDVLGDGPITAENLKALTWTDQVLRESMRLRPPVWAIERQAILDDPLDDDATIPHGTVVAISAWVLHRDPEHWPNPEGFDPERFSSERSDERPRYAYLPFGGGPRVCIGSAFAITEAKVILAETVRRFHVDLVPGQNLEPDFGITLRPKGGIHVRVKGRT